MTKNTKFLRILRVELEDLEMHADEMVAAYRERLQRHETTEHVYFENVAVLHNETRCLQRYIRILDETNPDEYDDPQQVADALKKRFTHVIDACGMARAAFVFAEHKIDKVLAYVHG